MRSSWLIGRTERPSTTEISTSTALIWLKRLVFRKDDECRATLRRRPAIHIEAVMLAEPLSPDLLKLRREDGQAVEWVVSRARVPYPQAVAEMEARAAAIAAGEAPERVWLIEHPPLYTAGVSARAEDLLQPDRFEVHQTCLLYTSDAADE